MAPSRLRLSLAEARSIQLDALGLSRPPPKAARKADLLAAIRAMHLLQIDTISVVARSPYLVLWSRLGTFEPRWLDALLAGGKLFEYWAHAACFLPIEDYGLYRWRMLEHPGRGATPAALETVLRRVREGEVRSTDFESPRGLRNGWWDWKPEKRALEHLFNAGVLMIARREGFQRIYDLRERVLPGWDDARAPSAPEARRALAGKALRALGVARPRWVKRYLQDVPGLPAVETLEEAVRVDLEGSEAFVHRDFLRAPRAPARTTLLSPFDPLVSDRARVLDLFGFDYRIEVYTPLKKRRFGYFSLPILHRGALVGRLDPKAHRQEGLLEIRALHLERGVAVTDDLVEGLASALLDFAGWHGTPEIAVRGRGRLAAALSGRLRRR